MKGLIFMETEAFKTSIDISAAGGGCQLRLGDIDGDGRMELIFAKGDVVSDERYFPHQTVCVTVFSAEGKLLWQVGDPNYRSRITSCDIPVQVYDIDKDGKNEVILIMNGELLILDGKTSEVKNKVPLPGKYVGGSITIADLEGTGYAQNIIIKNKFSRMWAYDVNLNILWSFQGNIGCCPAVYDINGDGREEIIAGYNVLDSNGSLLWKADMPAHANSVCVDCLYGDDRPVVLMAGPSICAYTAEGELLWELDEPASNIAVGVFRENIGTKDILILDNMSLFDSNGRFLCQKNETIYLATPVIGFDSRDKVYIAGHKKEDVSTTLYDGYMRPCYSLPFFGSITCGDLLGGGNSQIIIYNDETAEIYSSAETDLSMAERPYPRPQQRQYYNVSVHNTLPLSQLSSGYLVEDFASQNILKWAETYTNLNLHNSYTKVTRSEYVLILATLLHLKEDISENFADVFQDSNYYDAVGTFKKLGIIDGENNLFMPDSPITVAYANSILENLNIPLKFNFDEKYELSKQDMARLVISLTEQNQ